MKLYKREGRKFIACELVDNTGKYYQSDGTFSDYKTEASIGLCISSSITEDIVMYLKDGEFKLGAIPTSIIMLKALLKFRRELNLPYSTYYKCINPDDHADYVARSVYGGGAACYPASLVYFVTALTRQIIKVRKC